MESNNGMGFLDFHVITSYHRRFFLLIFLYTLYMSNGH